MIAGTQMVKKDRFLFSNTQAQSAEARLNAREAQQFCERWVPKHLKSQPPEPETTEAGACFRKVSKILKGRSK